MRSLNILVLTAFGLCLASCVRPPASSLNALDHTISITVQDHRECACLAALALVTDPVSRTPCVSGPSTGGCAIREDCAMPQAPEPLRQAVLSCKVGS